MMELMTMDGNAALDGGMQLIENAARTCQGGGLPFDADPTVARGDVHLQSSLEVVEEAGIVAVEGLSRPGIFKFQGD